MPWAISRTPRGARPCGSHFRAESLKPSAACTTKDSGFGGAASTVTGMGMPVRITRTACRTYRLERRDGAQSRRLGPARHGQVDDLATLVAEGILGAGPAGDVARLEIERIDGRDL